MRWTLFLPLLLLSVFLTGASKPLEESSYKSRNPELGIVYRPIDWDRQQWEEVFRDPTPPASWTVMPIAPFASTTPEFAIRRMRKKIGIGPRPVIRK